ncbi:MAG: type I restriction endonuclease subunit R, partial [Aeriscardovia sp.]|nr:type I restriction endonuclease subunit R [Aeriscardovia sp.]
DYIARNFNFYTHKGRYNSILAAESIEAAKEYWTAFKGLEKEGLGDFKIAIVYSSQGGEEDEIDPGAEKAENRTFLNEAIAEYNREFDCNYSMENAQSFQEYYRDISEKMKKRELDLLIVVNMFLTGFDSKRLSTLWVDKNLEKHNLLQAFSRTNRIFDSTKDKGIIVSFRDLEEKLDESLAIYGSDAKADKGLIFGRSYEDLIEGWEDKDGKHKGYRQVAQDFQREFPVGRELVGGREKRKFAEDWNEILKRSNLLSTFPEFEKEDPISPRDRQTYNGIYLNLRERFRDCPEENPDLTEVVWEVKLLSQKEIDVDYILNLCAKGGTMDDARRVIDESPVLFPQKEVILKYLSDPGTADGKEDFSDFRRREREKALDQIIKDAHLEPEKTRQFCKEWIRTQNHDPFVGCGFAGILPPLSLFDKERAKKKEEVRNALCKWAEKYAILG